MFTREVVVDGKGHILGRLASYVAKELLNGQRVVVVRCDKLVVSGSLYRTKVRFQQFMSKSHRTNPKRGLHHYRAPSRIFWRTVRGMLPHKTPRGAAALGRIKVFEGIPAPYDTKSRKVVPDALKVVKLRSDQEFCQLGQVSQLFGWNQQNLIDKLEGKRITRSAQYYKKKVETTNRRRAALNLPEVKKITQQLAAYGY